MNHTILHVNFHGNAGGPPPPLPWGVNFTAHGVVVLRAGSLHEALAYCRAYPLMLVIFEIGDMREQALAELRELTATRNGGSRPVFVGLYSGNPDADARAQLAEAGIDDLISRDDPDRFILWRVKLLLMLQELQMFEKTRMDVVQLAQHTREHLHDLSQPLSAVQGRLQLLAAKCPQDDPNSKTFQDLVRLILEVSQQVMEIQQIHRKYS